MKAKSKGTITVRLKKGLSQCTVDQRSTVKGLGLRRREDSRTLENTSAVRGMIKKVLHLLDVTAETR
ncbi:MAG TPA: 50S ribosomal protein L30 [Oligoflexia bacterium]|nr:50S ribosomal protein L30 [Oligoflexia bacterium]